MSGRRRGRSQFALIAVVVLMGVWGLVGCDPSRDDVGAVTTVSPTPVLTVAAVSPAPRVVTPTARPTPVLSAQAPAAVLTPTPGPPSPAPRDRTSATGTPRAEPRQRQRPRSGPRTPTAKPQPRPQPTPAGSPTAAPAAAPEVEPERTPAAEPARWSDVRVVYVSRPPPTTPCVHSWDWGTWQRRQSVAWSPDGSEIFFTLGGAVFVAPPDGSRVRQVADAQVTAGHEVYGFEVHGLGPDDDRRAIEAEARARYGLIEEYRLGPMSAISVTPDGTRFLYSTCAHPRLAAVKAGRSPGVYDYEYGLAIRDVAGGAARRLTTGDKFENFPAWSPDGTRIAFLTGHSGYVRSGSGTRGPLRYVRLNTMASDGSDLRDLTDGTEVRELLLHPPQWSPDGQRLAFIAVTREREGREAEPSLYTVRTDGTEFRRLTAAVSPPSWSPDGQRLAVARPLSPDGVELITIQADGTDVRPVTAIEGWQFTNGRQRAYFSRSDWQGEFVPRAAEAWIETLAWSPVGDQILYTCGAGFCVTSTDGEPMGESPRYARETTDAELIRRYARGRQPAAAWSPDGSRIAVVIWSDSDAEVILEHVAPDWSDRQVLVWHGSGTKPVAAGGRDLDAGANRAACAAGYVAPQPDANPGLVRDCQVLADLAPDDDGRLRWNWNAGTPVDQWEGVTVAGSPPRVTELRLAGIWPATSRALSAPVAAALAELTELRVLNLGSTPFHGPIPAQWGTLEKLQTLVLYGSQVSGPIPPVLGNLSGLRTLDLSDNNLAGSLPPELGHLASLETLELSGNDLTGAIPSELGQLTNVSTLRLDRNRLSGPIPDGLGELPNLNRLHLEHNQLTGEIPATLAQARHLEFVDLEGNQLTGCVPPGLKVLRRDELGLPDCEAGA